MEIVMLIVSLELHHIFHYTHAPIISLKICQQLLISVSLFTYVATPSGMSICHQLSTLPPNETLLHLIPRFQFPHSHFAALAVFPNCRNSFIALMYQVHKVLVRSIRELPVLRFP